MSNATINVQQVSSLLQNNWASQVSVLGLQITATNGIDWITDKPTAVNWFRNSLSKKAAIVCHGGKSPKSRFLIPGSWRLDDEVVIDIYVKDDTLPNLLVQRANLAAVVNSILESNSSSITNFFIKPKSSVPNELATYVKQTITVTVSIIQ